MPKKNPLMERPMIPPAPNTVPKNRMMQKASISQSSTSAHTGVPVFLVLEISGTSTDWRFLLLLPVLFFWLPVFLPDEVFVPVCFFACILYIVFHLSFIYYISFLAYVIVSCLFPSVKTHVFTIFLKIITIKDIM